jgi:imidazole glycerol phosphate synthase subunit HisF
MAYSADVNYNGATRVSFGAPAAGVANNIANALSINAAGSSDLSSVPQIADPFGRNIVVVASGASTATITVIGGDYTGQAMQETFTANGTTPVVGNKAWKWFSSVTYTGSAGVTINIGTGAKLGLPYKTVRVGYEIAAGVVAAAGALQPPSLVDPQTATTNDPRGMYTPTTALNGSTIISASCDCVNDINTANHGGLLGIAQFGG